MLKPIKNIIDITAIGNAKMGILLKEKNPFRAISKKNITDKFVPVITKDIFIPSYFLYIILL
jgi:hypothetical protein